MRAFLLFLFTLCACSRAAPDSVKTESPELVSTPRLVRSAVIRDGDWNVVQKHRTDAALRQGQTSFPAPAMAAGPDNDCSGMLQSPFIGDRLWLKPGVSAAMGEFLTDGFHPVFYFLTAPLAYACSDGTGMPVRIWTGSGWKSQ